MRLWSLVMLLGVFSCAGINKKDETKLNSSELDSLILAIEGHNVAAVKDILGKLNPDREKWSYSDSSNVHAALEIVAAHGSKCDTQIGDYLWSQGAQIVSSALVRESTANLTREDRKNYLIPLCGNYWKSSYQKDRDFHAKNPSDDDGFGSVDNSIFEFTNAVNNNFVAYIKTIQFNKTVNAAGLKKYKELMDMGIADAKSRCKVKPSGKGCLSLGTFKNLVNDMKTKVTMGKDLQVPWKNMLNDLEKQLL